MNADGSNQRRLTHSTKGRGNSGPHWSPDGKRITFGSIRDGNAEVYVMDADGANVQRLTRHEAEDAPGNWSPDGKHIVFTSDRDGNWEIYVMGADGSNMQRLTHHPADDWTPRWSPDGTKIAFHSNQHAERYTSGCGLEVYVMDADGSNVRRLTHTRGNNASSWYPSWSRDGKQILFHSNRDGLSTLAPANRDLEQVLCDERDDLYEYEIYVMDADGSNVQRLTFNRKIELHPDW